MDLLQDQKTSFSGGFSGSLGGLPVIFGTLLRITSPELIGLAAIACSTMRARPPTRTLHLKGKRSALTVEQSPWPRQTGGQLRLYPARRLRVSRLRGWRDDRAWRGAQSRHQAIRAARLSRDVRYLFFKHWHRLRNRGSHFQSALSLHQREDLYVPRAPHAPG